MQPTEPNRAAEHEMRATRTAAVLGSVPQEKDAFSSSSALHPPPAPSGRD